ncbi:uncharacterized protein AtWU_04113 [Aspergillus tubingensis]|uniref:uncharacterized protein n=1 Tax=Aspergillus tubingensis TaxID=5068 RepID=UPI001579DEB6|nr:uncharacterized protein AtWU_04113 [Aspergillus tubingensis]GFN14313.1 hypothetical protein AtWU_04113 [Aspergillus tubingensis]
MATPLQDHAIIAFLAGFVDWVIGPLGLQHDLRPSSLFVRIPSIIGYISLHLNVIHRGVSRFELSDSFYDAGSGDPTRQIRYLVPCFQHSSAPLAAIARDNALVICAYRLTNIITSPA